MVFSMDALFRRELVRLLILPALIILLIPTTCVASTPPLQPSLLLTVSNNSAVENAPLSLQLTWNGVASYNIPPENIVVEVVDMKDGSTLGTFSIPRQSDACEAGNICSYGASVDMGILPPGEFMLVAYDPLSGASARQEITISPHGEGTGNFLVQSEGEPVFFLVSGMLLVFLVIVLAILVINRNGGEE
jgi:hypothetical protein